METGHSMDRVEGNVFMNNGNISFDELKFIVKTVLILVSSNYAHKSCSFITDHVVTEIAKRFKDSEFIKCGPATNSDTIKFVFECADIVDKYLQKWGFSVFAANLMIKRLAILFDDKYLSLLDAPLNKDELALLNAKKANVMRISDLNKENYPKVMELGRSVALPKSLYQWELEEYNK